MLNLKIIELAFTMVYSISQHVRLNKRYFRESLNRPRSQTTAVEADSIEPDKRV